MLDGTTAIESITDDNILEVGETWTWNAATDTELNDVVVNSATTFTATGYGEDSLGNPVTYPTYLNERDSVDVDVISPDTAVTIDASPKLIYSGGFMEYFNPITGEGLGGNDFTWTAAMWLVNGRHNLPSLRGAGAGKG